MPDAYPTCLLLEDVLMPSTYCPVGRIVVILFDSHPLQLCVRGNGPSTATEPKDS